MSEVLRHCGYNVFNSVLMQNLKFKYYCKRKYYIVFIYVTANAVELQSK